jgi:hypothetical protein
MSPIAHIDMNCICVIFNFSSSVVLKPQCITYLTVVYERGSVFKGKIVRIVEEALWYCLQGKSALWSHLSNYQELKECNDTSKPIDPNLLTPGEYIDSIASIWVLLLMLWWFIHLFLVVLPLRLCYRFSWFRVTCVQLHYWCLVVQSHLCSVALLMFGGSGSLVFSCATDVWWFRVTCVQLRYWCLVVQGHLCSVAPPVQLCYWCLVVQSHLCCFTSSVVFLELVLFS